MYRYQLFGLRHATMSAAMTSATVVFSTHPRAHCNACPSLGRSKMQSWSPTCVNRVRQIAAAAHFKTTPAIAAKTNLHTNIVSPAHRQCYRGKTENENDCGPRSIHERSTHEEGAEPAQHCNFQVLGCEEHPGQLATQRDSCTDHAKSYLCLCVVGRAGLCANQTQQ